MQIVEELHAARVGKSVHLPVVPPAGELMSMEIDLVEEDVPSSAGIRYILIYMICSFLRIVALTSSFYSVQMKVLKCACLK